MIAMSIIIVVLVVSLVVATTLQQSATHTMTTMTTETTIVTSTVTSTPVGPTIYKTDQVVPIDIASATGPDTVDSFTPPNVRLVIGVNNTVSFVNSGKGFVAVDSIYWPANGTGFSTPILSSGGNWSITLTSPGLYNYTEYIHPTGTFGSILVLAVPGISASTSNDDAISFGRLSLCASCYPGPSFSASMLVKGSSAFTELVLYLNGTYEGLTPVNDNMTNRVYEYNVNLANSYLPIQAGRTYFVEVIAVFADDQLAVVTASTLAV
jgi:hypothetical protein